jgi:hypothetical protein
VDSQLFIADDPDRLSRSIGPASDFFVERMTFSYTINASYIDLVIEGQGIYAQRVFKSKAAGISVGI